MSTIKIIFPDQKVREFGKGSTPFEIANQISSQLAKKILVAKFNGAMVDISTPINEDGNIIFYTWNEDEGKSTFWHSSAHLLAESVQYFFPDAKFTIGPPIDNGFYYDIDFNGYKLTEEDIVKIEKKNARTCAAKCRLYTQ